MIADYHLDDALVFMKKPLQCFRCARTARLSPACHLILRMRNVTRPFVIIMRSRNGANIINQHLLIDLTASPASKEQKMFSYIIFHADLFLTYPLATRYVFFLVTA